MASSASRALRLITARPWLTAVIVVILAGGATGIYLLTRGGTSAQAQVTSRLVTVSTGTVRESVSTTGTISPADESDVSFGSSGTVTSVRVSVGDTVRKGQLLGTIDPLSLRANLAQDRASLASAKAQLTAAEDDTSTTSAQLSAQRASVKTAKAAVTAAKQSLAGAKLHSPIAGTVATVNVSTGDQTGGSSSNNASTNGSTNGTTNGSSNANGNGTSQSNGSNSSTASSSSSSSSSTAAFVVIGAKKWTVTTSVDDTQVGLIAKGDQAQITTGNAGGLVFGTVSSVSVLASDSSGSAAYPVDIAITGSPSGLHDGASATVSIIYKQLSNVLTVATTAIHTDGTTKYVYVNSSGKKAKKTVTTGMSSGGTTQITSGLAAGDQVYVDVLTSRGSGTGSSTNTGNSNRTGFGGGYGGGGGGGGFGGGGFGGGGAVPGGGFGAGNP